MTFPEPGPAPVAGSSPHRFRNGLELFWIVVAAITLALLIERGILSFSRQAAHDKWGAWVVLFYLVALFVLFLSEGVSHSVTQLHKADREGLQAAIARYPNLLDKQRQSLPGFLETVFANFDGFLIGRQIISLSAVALLAVAIEKSPETRDDAVRANTIAFFRYLAGLFPAVPEPVGALSHQIAHLSEQFFGDFVAAFLLSALFPCWLAQILPGLLASRGSVRFFSIPGSKLCARAAIAIGRSGAGLPGELAYKVMASPAGFDREEHIGAGDASMFLHQSAGYGEAISSRIITMTIREDALVLQDVMTIDVMGTPSSKIDQTLRIAMTHCAPGDIEVENARLDYPTGTKGNVSTKAAVVSIADKKSPAEVMTQEVIIFAKVALEDAIPRGDAVAEAVRIEFNYKTKPLSLDPEVSDLICFDVTKPTKTLEIRLSHDPDLFCEAPTLTVGGIEEVLLRRWDAEEVEGVHFSNLDPSQGRIMTIRYPRLGARYALKLNMMPAQP